MKAWVGACSVAALTLVGCGGSLPSPQATIDAYTSAAKSGDALALHRLLTERDRARLSAGDVATMTRENSAELREQASKFTGTSTVTEAKAELAFEDGEKVSLDLEHGSFQIGAVGTLPGGAATPAQAVADLRRALARRSYVALLRALTPRARRILEDMLQSMAKSLAHPDSLPVVESGDTAEVRVPGGHLVKLRREGTEWHVEYFE